MHPFKGKPSTPEDAAMKPCSMIDSQKMVRPRLGASREEIMKTCKCEAITMKEHVSKGANWPLFHDPTGCHWCGAHLWYAHILVSYG